MSEADFTPLYARIQRFIREEIASGRLQEGERVPSEPELAAKFATTRATVGRALQQLVFEKVIVRRVGSGTFVADKTINAPLDLSRVRSFEEQVAAAKGTISYDVLDFSPRSASESESERLKLPPRGVVFALDRLRLVDGRKVSLERRVIPEQPGSRITHEMLRSRSLHHILDREFQLRVMRIEGTIRADIASKAVAQSLSIKRGDPLLVRDYILFNAEHRPLVCGESFYRSDFHIDYVIQQS